MPGRAYKLPTCVCAYSVQDNIINFDCDHVLFSIRNQLLRTRITFLRGVRCRRRRRSRCCCMHRINVTIIIMCVSCCCCFWCSFTLIFVYSNTQISVRSFWSRWFTSIAFSMTVCALIQPFNMFTESFCSGFDSILLLLLRLNNTSILQCKGFTWQCFSDGECVMLPHDVWLFLLVPIIVESVHLCACFLTISFFLQNFFSDQVILYGPLIIYYCLFSILHVIYSTLAHIYRILNAMFSGCSISFILSLFRSFNGIKTKIV